MRSRVAKRRASVFSVGRYGMQEVNHGSRFRARSSGLSFMACHHDVSEAGTVSGVLAAGRMTAANAKVTTAGGKVTLKLKFTAAARKRLAKAKSVKLTLQVVA